jgi:hypothetical protein
MSEHEPRHSERVAVHELDPELRDRLLALDQPVPHPDWRDVRSRAVEVRPRLRARKALRITVAASLVCVAAVVAAPAMGLRVGDLIDFWSAPSAPESAQSVFTQAALWTRGIPKGLELGKTRRIVVDEFPGESERLFVAPLARGGFCYEWALKPGTASIWVDELGGCSDQSSPLTLGYDDTRVSIVADPSLVDRVAVKLGNGRVVRPSLRWVSAPVDAGFLLYQPPSGVHVAEIDALQGGDLVERYPIDQEGPTPRAR